MVAGSSHARISAEPFSRITGIRECKKESCLLAVVVMTVYV